MGNILEKSKLNLHFRSCVRVDDKLYFSEAFFNGLFQMDLNDFSVKFICHFSAENKGRLLLHGGHAVRYRDVIYFFPTCTKRIHYYNLITGDEDNISLPLIGDKEFAVSGILQKDNRIWLFSAELFNGVFVLDLEKNRITKVEILSELLLKYDKVTNFIEIPEEGNLFTYCAADFKLLEIDAENEQIKEYRVPIETDNIIAINYHRGKFYFIDGNSGDLYEWAWNDIRLRKFVAQDVEMGLVEGSPFSGCCFVDDDIYMIPCRSKYVMRIEKGNGGIMKRAFDYPEDFQYVESVQGKYKPMIMQKFEIIRSEIWFYPYGGNQLLIYDTKSGHIVGKKITVDIKEVFPCEGMIFEKDQEVLEYFCHGIKKDINDVVSKDFQVGEKIYKEIKL